MIKKSSKIQKLSLFDTKFLNELNRYDPKGFTVVQDTLWGFFDQHINAIDFKTKKTPCPLGDTSIFELFQGVFHQQAAKKQHFSQHLLTKILENVFWTLIITHLKYHVNTTSRSKKIASCTPLVDKPNLENLTFIIYSFFKAFF